MREFCLLTKDGTIVNMATCFNGAVPHLNEFQADRGYHWEPVSAVSEATMHNYYYYNHRP